MLIHPANNHTLNAKRLALLVSIALWLAACATPPAVQRQPPAQQLSDKRAWQFLISKNYREAAKEYLRLESQSSPPQSYKFRLQAAEACIEGRLAKNAEQILDKLQIPENETQLIAWQRLLEARLELLKNNHDQALKILTTLPLDETTPAPLRRQIHAYRAIAYSNTGRYHDELAERILLDPLLKNEQERRQNRQASWEAIYHLKPAELSRVGERQSGIFYGWVELAILAKTKAYSATVFEQALFDWKQHYPNHPANQEILPGLLEKRHLLDIQASQIALLLPFSGQFAGAATAIRDGFLAAWYSDSGNANRPVVKTYDATTTNVSTVYRQAIDTGSDFVVGPLEKPTIQKLLGAGKPPVPTLVLNQVNETTQPQPSSGANPLASSAELNLYQFGLAPEDDAQQVAERAWFDGHVSALAITPASAWGSRVFNTFKQQWEHLGGRILEHQTYGGEQDYASLVNQLINVSDSQKRAEQLKSALGKELVVISRMRRDADFIFLAASPDQARLIQPHILLHNAAANTVPVYSTSHVFSGNIQQSSDDDLNGIAFSDMPWVLNTPQSNQGLRRAIERNWPERLGDYLRLYALGVDAYNIIPHLGRLRLEPEARLDGQTGVLSIDDNGRIHRQLTWARFSNGRPQLLND
jgi:outer membrane PBP1 activator LpoA protein